MTMKITPVRTHWNTDEAWIVLEFLDELKDMLWETCGDQIIEMHREATELQLRNTDQGELDFDDDIPF